MRNWIFIFVLGFAALLFSQSIADLERSIPSEHNQARLETLQKLAAHYATHDPQKSVEYYTDALQTSRTLNDKISEAIIRQDLGILYINRLGNYQASLEQFLASLEIIQRFHDKRNLANALCNVAIAYELLGNNEEAIRYNQEALQSATQLSDKRAMALAENNLGNIYSRSAHYDKALKSYLHAYQLRDEIGEDSSIILNNIGIIYERLGKNSEALRFHQRALQAKRRVNAPAKSIAASLTNIANVQQRLGELESAYRNHKEALSINQQLSDANGIAISLQNIAATYFEQQDYEKSLAHFHDAITLFRQLNNTFGIVTVSIEKGKIYFIQKDFDEAEKVWLQAEQLAKQINANDQLIEIYDRLNQLASEKNDFEAAHRFLAKQSRIKDEVVSTERVRSLAEMTTKFGTKQKEEQIIDLEFTKEQLTREKDKKEKQLQVAQVVTEEQERQIEILEKEREINELQIKNTQLELLNKELELSRITNQRLYFGIVFLLVLLLAITFYNQYRSKKRDVENLEAANAQIQLQNEKLEDLYLKENKLVKELEELNATKNKFFSIIAHDLKNGFSSLLSGSKLLTTHIDNMEKEAIKEIAEDLKSSTDTLFSLLQNLLQWSRIQTGRIDNKPEELPLFMVIHYNLRLLRNAAETKQIQIEAHVEEDMSVRADKNMLNSVLQNLTYNALKFTKPGGKIQIVVSEKETNMQICVIDNGIGMTEKTKKKLFRIDEHVSQRGTNNEQGTGLGLLLCKEFIEKNKGKVWVESELEKGTSVCFTLPRTNKQGVQDEPTV